MDKLMQIREIILTISKATGVLFALFLICFLSLLVILWIGFNWEEDSELYGWPISQTSCPTSACDQH